MNIGGILLIDFYQTPAEEHHLTQLFPPFLSCDELLAQSAKHKAQHAS